MQAGADAIVVSNHGGRQLDSSPSGLGALPEVVAQVAGRVPVLMDGGVRRGTDVLKAMALGASAVLVGRPAVWGLAAGGQEGVEGVLGILRAEFENAMALTGCRSVAEIGPPSDRARATDRDVDAAPCDAPRSRLPPLPDDERLRPPHPQRLLRRHQHARRERGAGRRARAGGDRASPTTTRPKASTRRSPLPRAPAWRSCRGSSSRPSTRGPACTCCRTGWTPQQRSRCVEELQRLTDTRFRRGEMMVAQAPGAGLRHLLRTRPRDRRRRA